MSDHARNVPTKHCDEAHKPPCAAQSAATPCTVPYFAQDVSPNVGLHEKSGREIIEMLGNKGKPGKVMERQGKSWNAKGSLFSVDNLRAGLGQIARNMIEEIPSLYHHSPHVAQKGKVCGHALEVSYGPAPNAAKQTEDIRGSVNRLVMFYSCLSPPGFFCV